MSKTPWNRERPALLVVDKPIGMTSHDVVKQVRRLARLSRIGHAGTLDPAASGVLVLCLGIATRLAEYLTGHDKEYVSTFTLGIETDTYDADGAVVATRESRATREEIEAAMSRFRGEIEQRPPAYSAVRVAGKRAHDLARKGVDLELTARRVTVHRFEIVEFAPPTIDVIVSCSAGTYVRSLAHDLGAALGCGAHVSALRRTRSGNLTLEHAIALDALEDAVRDDPSGDSIERFLIPVATGLSDWPSLEVDDAVAASVYHGHAVPLGADLVATTSPFCRIHDARGELLAIAEVTASRMAQPRKVLR